jgi:hypothetical protein
MLKRLFSSTALKSNYFPKSLQDPKSSSFSPIGGLSKTNRFQPKYTSPYATSYPKLNPIPDEVPLRRPYERIITVRKLVRLSSKGKHMRFDAWCLAGDRTGSVGLAHATSTRASKATQLAMRRARNNMKHFELFEGRTLYHGMTFDYNGMRMRLIPKEPGRHCGLVYV